MSGMSPGVSATSREWCFRLTVIAGNAFLGGFIAGLAYSGGDAYEGELRSYLVEDSAEVDSRTIRNGLGVVCRPASRITRLGSSQRGYRGVVE